MRSLILLALVTVFYASYNLLVKASSNHAGQEVSTPILATISLQVSALCVSLAYLLYLFRHGTELALPGKAYLWAMGAGLCIGLAEILYFYLFRGFEGERPIQASSAIPFIVGGTIVITVVVSILVFGESLNRGQWAGVALAFAGMLVLAVNS